MLQGQVEMLLPIAIGDYTDFFSSMHHAKNCGTIFRGPENPIPANWYADIGVHGMYTLFRGNFGKQRKYVLGLLSLWTFFFLFHIHNFQKNFRFHIPIAYHGRASSIVISGTDIVRPRWDNFPGSILHLQLQHVMRSWMISTSSETLWFRSKCIWLQNCWHPKNNSGAMAYPEEALLNCLSLHFWKL